MEVYLNCSLDFKNIVTLIVSAFYILKVKVWVYEITIFSACLQF